MADLDKSSSDGDMAGGSDEEAAPAKPKPTRPASKPPRASSSAAASSSSGSGCFLCGIGEGELSHTYRSKPLHQVCNNAVRAHARLIQSDMALRPPLCPEALNVRMGALVWE